MFAVAASVALMTLSSVIGSRMTNSISPVNRARSRRAAPSAWLLVASVAEMVTVMSPSARPYRLAVPLPVMPFSTIGGAPLLEVKVMAVVAAGSRSVTVKASRLLSRHCC